MGIVSLEGMDFYAHHGYYEEERKIGNKYTVDVSIDVDFTKAADEDELSGTVNYERVYEIVAEVMGNEALLLEHLAGRIIHQVRAAFPEINKVEVMVAKHNPPIQGLCKRAVIRMQG